MSIEIREVEGKNGFKAFVNFQFQLYKDNKYWVPPIKGDEVKALTKEGNPAYRFCDANYWLAYKNGKCVGRIGAIINHKYIEKTGEKIGRFTRAEFIDDNEVVDSLFAVAEEWIKSKGMVGVQGPLGFTNLDHQGMMIEGHDHLPSAASEYHLPYYQKQMERIGYEKEVDWIEFRLFLEEIPEKAKRVSEIIKKRNGLTVKSFSSSKELMPYASTLFELLNKAFAELFSVVELDKEMIDYYVNRYMMMLNTDFVKLVFDENENIVAFIIGLPSLSEGLQKAKGKLLPFGWWHLKKALNKPKVVDLMLTGVLPEFQGKGVAAILINELQMVMEKYGVKEVETTGIFETNSKAIQNWKNYKHIQHKRKRCWKKAFS